MHRPTRHPGERYYRRCRLLRPRHHWLRSSSPTKPCDERASSYCRSLTLVKEPNAAVATRERYHPLCLLQCMSLLMALTGGPFPLSLQPVSEVQWTYRDVRKGVLQSSPGLTAGDRAAIC
jgi:hypothetical protein